MGLSSQVQDQGDSSGHEARAKLREEFKESMQREVRCRTDHDTALQESLDHLWEGFKAHKHDIQLQGPQGLPVLTTTLPPKVWAQTVDATGLVNPCAAGSPV